MIYEPAPGIVVIEKRDAPTQTLTLSNTDQTHLLYGTVIEVGSRLTTDFDAKLEPDKYVKIGDNVYFLSYEGGYDWAKIEGRDIYFVKVQDIRCIIKNE